MTEVVARARNLTKKYRDNVALDDISFTLEANRIYGLLGRNGAGKTTVMSILTAQNFPTDGVVEVFGQPPFENSRVLSRLCFIRESQKYPENFTPKHAFKASAMFFQNWDQGLCEALIQDFELPMTRTIKKLSRGQLSAVGVIIGLASRAELTFFDEPYLGLDAVARQIFYDRLLQDYAEHPRTIVLSSHLIDEVANLLEHVIVLDHGRIIMNDDTESIRGSAYTAVGPGVAVREFVGSKPVLYSESIGSFAQMTVSEPLSEEDAQKAALLGVEIVPVSLQQLVVRKTLGNRSDEFNGNGSAKASKRGETA